MIVGFRRRVHLQQVVRHDPDPAVVEIVGISQARGVAVGEIATLNLAISQFEEFQQAAPSDGIPSQRGSLEEE